MTHYSNHTKKQSFYNFNNREIPVTTSDISRKNFEIKNVASFVQK